MDAIGSDYDISRHDGAVLEIDLDVSVQRIDSGDFGGGSDFGLVADAVEENLQQLLTVEESEGVS